ALPLYVTGSRRCCAIADQHVQALFGVVEDRANPRFGVVWAVGSDRLVRRHRKGLVAHARQWLAHLGEGYERLWNYADARNEVHLRFLRFLGCRWNGRTRLGPDLLDFVGFEFVSAAQTVSPASR